MSRGGDNSQIRVNYGVLDNAHANVTSTVNFMNSQLDGLKQYLRPFIQKWQGEGSDAYQSVQRRWDTAAADLNQILALIPPALEETTRLRRKADSQDIPNKASQVHIP